MIQTSNNTLLAIVAPLLSQSVSDHAPRSGVSSGPDHWTVLVFNL
jgi:hypothetical protein